MKQARITGLIVKNQRRTLIEAVFIADDYAQPDAADGEPVFWTDAADQVTPDDAFVQADAAESPEPSPLPRR